ncbi:tripartite motif family like 2 [Phyllostomus discolor]|uniref:Probable E3 ubiquitin-protein ligase TRIML2 n=1 Tax=Phyllostomus discolor TaxID=89673 RepID=A0A6J2MRL7_9CHIR|nr:probable E3 ubiquitin-protein ligase TRIML2 [Phyllostomus discolor]KAF6085091.1 tripartite motif family like 2 [Phyllostomus discolor]
MFKWPSPELQGNIPEENYCQKHLELLLLFCEDDQVTLCGQCLLSEDHKNHTVYGIKEAAENYRKLFRDLVYALKEKLEATKVLVTEEQEKMVIIQGEERDFREVIEAEYKMIFRLMTEESDSNLQGPTFNLNFRKATPTQKMAFVAELEGKFQETLRRLSDLGKENMRKLQESELRLYELIYGFHVTIIELERRCKEPPIYLLKNARECFKLNSESVLLQTLEPAEITDPRLCQIPGVRKILEGLQRPITLDPTTAHSCLLLSADLRSVRFRGVQQSVRGRPERLDYSASVLGAEIFASGRHYWEVDVEKATAWQLGVYEDTAHGPDGMFQVSGEKYLLTASMMGTEYTFWAFPPLKRVFSGERVHKVGVFVDHKYGQIAFYDVTKGLLIYNFSRLVFHGAVRPLFSLCFPNGGKDTDTLTICLPEADSCAGAVGPQPSALQV